MTLVVAFLVVWAAVAALYDWRQRRLPNFLTLGALSVGAVYALIYGAPLGGAWYWNYAAAAVGLVVLLPVYAIGVMGAGDVKFFAAMGMLGGPTILLPTLLVASLIVGAHAFLTLALRLPAAVYVTESLRRHLRLPPVGPERRLPFGVGLAAGFVAAVLGWLPLLDWNKVLT